MQHLREIELYVMQLSLYMSSKVETVRVITNRFLRLDLHLALVLVLSFLLVMSFPLSSMVHNIQAAEITLEWNDPDNDPAEVDMYTIYYWQPDWEMPASENTGLNLTHTLSDLEPGQAYEFAVTVGNPNGTRESVYSNIVAARLPEAIFSAEADANDPLTVSFTDGSSGLITDWEWDFDDGNTSMAQNPTHTYSAAGSYTVTLTVRGAEGSDSTTTTLTVQDPSNQAPTANAGPDQTVGINTSVSFDGSGSSDPEGGPLTYSWDFGDGTPVETGVTVTHTYTTANSYIVTLTVTDDAGATDSDSMNITVTPSVLISVSTNQLSYTSGEPIVVEFSGGPGNAKDWLVLLCQL